MARGELAVLRDDTELLLPGESLLAQLVPALVELALVLIRPFLRHVVRGMRCAGREVSEERLVGHEGLLLANPLDRFGGHVVREVIALFGRLVRLDRRRAFVERRIPLVGFPADKAIEVLEAPSTTGRPVVERAQGAGLPHRHFVAFTKLRGRVAVQPQRLRKRRHCVRQEGVVTGCRGRYLGNATHAGRMMISTGQHRLSRRRAQRSRVEAIVFQAARGELLEVRRLARPAERAGRAEANVVDQDDQNIRCARWRPQFADRRIFGVRVFGIVGRQTDRRLIRDGKHGSMDAVF